MSEKITFQELIESIAEETDNSKQFTQGFIRDFVEVINDGLEEDGKVNIAGFGKFNLRRVDEREGYNPQTEEKITIPAHNKLVFKPYKNLRELVNAPYAHQEPELIKKESEDESADEPSTDPQASDQSDFIPAGSPASQQSTGETEEEIDSEEEAPFDFEDENEKEKESGEEDETATPEVPFAHDSEETSAEEEVDEEQDEDIVEFKADKSDDAIDEKLDKFFGGSDQPEEDDKHSDSVDDSPDQSEEPFDEADDIFGSAEDEHEEKREEKAASIPSLNQHRSTQKSSSANPIVIVAAAFILLLAAGGAWYFGLLSEGSQQDMESQEMIAATEDRVADNNQQQDQTDNSQQDQDPQQTADNNQDQPQDAGSSATASSSDDAQTANNENDQIEIEKGQTLWSLAEEQYGNPRLWPWIYGNNESVENPDIIFAGNSLSVPLPSGPDNGLNSADSVGVAKGYIATYRWYKDNDSSKAKNHLLGAKLYHDNISNIADVKIDEADLSYANKVR